MEENWKAVIGYEGLYEVSSLGRVRNCKTGRVLKLNKHSNNYLYVGLCKDGVLKTRLVHRIVAQAFVENPESKPCIDHINTIKTDNYYKNLCWCTPHENNMNELTRKRKSKAKKGENNPFYGKSLSEEAKKKISEANSKQVEIFKENISLGVFPSVTELVKQSENLFGAKLDHRRISAVCLGKRKSYKGYTFKYTD